MTLLATLRYTCIGIRHRPSVYVAFSINDYAMNRNRCTRR